MAKYLISLISLVLAALSLAPSYAHVLEAPPRLNQWSPELWREATVFNGQFLLYAVIGAPIDVAAIIAAALLAWVLRHEPRAFRPALAGAAALMVGLIVWAAVVSPANAILATWQPGPIPADFAGVRLRWEIGHMMAAAAKLVGLIAIAVAVTAPRLPARS